jgi:hypothetical protein
MEEKKDKKKSFYKRRNGVEGNSLEVFQNDWRVLEIKD